MVAARHLAALAALALLSPLAVSCVKIIGADEDPKSIAFELCKCQAEELDFLGPQESCRVTLEARLEGARPETRGPWMEQAIDLDCHNCQNLLKCYRTPPTCVDDACKETDECCEGLVCKSGSCGPP